ncbi:MAG: site-specific integrase, partial [Mediterranea sp.]|nr:site-specific integrase [Mediterranea sp.]
MKLQECTRLLSEKALADGYYRKSGIYSSVSRRICRYAGNDDISLDEVFTSGFLNGFRKGLLADEISQNTAVFYLNSVRSIHTAVTDKDRLAANPELMADSGLTANPGLFASLSIESVPTEKRAVSDETIACLHAADLSGNPRLEQCRDTFMLSFCLQGIPFVDLFHLRKSELKGDLLTYSRQKTGKPVSVHVLDEAWEYLSRLLSGHEEDTHFLLPFLTCSGKDGYKQYQTALRRYNRQLKM